MKYTFLIVCFFVLSKLSFSQWHQKEFVIGTFSDPRISYDKNFTKDSLSYAKAKNAYFNLLTGPQFYMGSRDFSLMDRTLQLAEKFNMKVLVIDSRMRIMDPAFNQDTALKIISHFKSLNSKAFEGYYIMGEIPKNAANQVNRWTNFFKKNDPDKLVYYYLLPNTAFNSKNNYEAYVNSFFYNKTSAPDVLSYDYYPFSKDGTILNSYFYNLDLISKKAGIRPFWSYILSTSTPNYTDPSDYQLKFSVFCPLAYGAKGIIYFTYETIPAKNGGNFGDAILDKNGNPTNKYATVKKINQYVSQVIGPVIMSSKKINTFHTSQQSGNEVLSNAQVLSLNSNLLKTSNNNLLIGMFKSLNSATQYLLIVNKQNQQQNNVQLSLSGNYTGTIALYPRMNDLNGSLEPQKINAQFASGQTSFTINQFLPGEAILVRY